MSTLQTPPPSPGLTLSNLTVPKERTYHTLVLLVSVLVWGLLTLGTFGVFLFYAAMFAVFMWIGNGLLIAHLRSEAVRVSAEQLPELHATFVEVCERLGLKEKPALYVLQAGGLLNAFATRFSGRNFVVVYSDFLEALGPSSAEMKFVLGHEVGHIQSRHILKQILLAPGLIFPLIGPAYRRAWETSCDRYGAHAAQDADAAVRAMLVITGGRENGRRLNPAAFADQHAGERGFFVSLHELTSTYPTLSRRVTDLMALKDGAVPRAPARHPLAYFFAMFMPGGNLGAGGPAAGMLFMVVMIGLLAAMAIPAFAKVRESSMAKLCIANQRMLSSALEQYHLEQGKGASSWDEIAGPGKLLETMPVCPQAGTYSAEYTEDDGYTLECSVSSHAPHAQPGAPGAGY